MTLVRWNPNRTLMGFPADMLNIQREMNKMFDSFFRGEDEDGSLLTSAWTPAADVAEHDNEYVVKLEVPGVTKDDVKITMRDHILTITGEKKEEKESKGHGYRRMERSYGSFSRSFTLPSDVAVDKIDASYKDGILSVTLPKAEESRPKQIDVKVK